MIKIVSMKISSNYRRTVLCDMASVWSYYLVVSKVLFAYVFVMPDYLKNSLEIQRSCLNPATSKLVINFY